MPISSKPATAFNCAPCRTGWPPIEPPLAATACSWKKRPGPMLIIGPAIPWQHISFGRRNRESCSPARSCSTTIAVRVTFRSFASYAANQAGCAFRGSRSPPSRGKINWHLAASPTRGEILQAETGEKLMSIPATLGAEVVVAAETSELLRMASIPPGKLCCRMHFTATRPTSRRKWRSLISWAEPEERPGT